MYSILDIETTGGKFNEEEIIEIAIYRFDGHKIIDQFISLVNPEGEIQPFVSKLTGINKKMLKNAPKFYEIAKRIIEITAESIIVAHNASFDYRILRLEFDRLGYTFERTALCSVELSKQLLPEQGSYSLGKLVRSLGIPITDRHRANGDAIATVKLFQYLLEKDLTKNIISSIIANNSLENIKNRQLKIIDALPEKLGVYYMYNAYGKLLFIGKNKNIKKAVNQYFTAKTKQAIYLQEHTHSVTFQLTGNQLVTDLKYNEEVFLNKPKFSPSNKEFNFMLVANFNENDYICFQVIPFSKEIPFLATFETIHQGQNFLYKITEEFKLCPKLQGLSQAKKNCHNFTIHKCNGACVGLEPSAEYNQRISEVFKTYLIDNQTVAIIDKGRTIDEKSLVLIKNGILKGYGFFHLNYQLSQLAIVENLITPISNSLINKDLVQSYLQKNTLKKIYFENENQTSFIDFLRNFSHR